MLVRIGTTFGCGSRAALRKKDIADIVTPAIAAAKMLQKGTVAVDVINKVTGTGLPIGASNPLDMLIEKYYSYIFTERASKSGKKYYDFSKDGDTSAWSIIDSAIKQAKKYI